jgi:phage gp36-like protein
MPTAYVSSAADLTVQPGALKGVSDADKQRAMDSANALVDSYLAARFQLPLARWGEDVKRAAATIATYYVLLKRGFSPEAGDAEQIRLSYEDTLKWLRLVADGVLTPDVVDAAGEGELGTATGAEAKGFVRSPDSDRVVGGGFFDKEGYTTGGVGPSRRRGW